MATFAEQIASYADKDPLDPQTFLQQMWQYLSPSQQEMFGAMLAQPQNVRRDVAVQGGQGNLIDQDPAGMRGSVKPIVEKKAAGAPPTPPSWSPESIMGMAQNNNVADVQAGLKADAGRIPEGVYTASNDPLKSNVISHTLPNGQKQNVYLRDTAANIQEDTARRIATNAINPASIQKAAAEGGVAKGTKIKLRDGTWLSVGE